MHRRLQPRIRDLSAPLHKSLERLEPIRSSTLGRSRNPLQEAGTERMLGRPEQFHFTISPGFHDVSASPKYKLGGGR
jgi:hypothetical protein